MSKIKPGIRKGVYVKQGDVIGYVGSTGLATGPHVCYRFWMNGRQVDPFKQKLPPGDPIKSENEQDYILVKDSLMQILKDNKLYDYKKDIIEEKTIVFLSLITFIGNTQNAFIQNKGQFPNQVVSKVNIPSGSLYIEKDGLFYSFYSSNDLRATHDSPEEQHLINAHSYRVNFLNSNFNVENELYHQSNYYENYYIGNDSLWAEYVRSYKFLEQKIFTTE